MLQDKQRGLLAICCNRLEIKTYGSLTLQPNFGLSKHSITLYHRRYSSINYRISKILSSYHLLLDIGQRKLINAKTELIASDSSSEHGANSVKTMENQAYHNILMEYPGNIHPSNKQKIVKHITMHSIKTTLEQPEAPANIAG